MPIMHGNLVAKHVQNGTAKVGPGAWVPLVASGSTPLSNRQWVEIQARGPGAIALAYSNKNADGTFTAPTYSGSQAKIIPANTMRIEPLSDNVNLYGRYIAKAGAGAGGMKVVVTEYQ